MMATVKFARTLPYRVMSPASPPLAYSRPIPLVVRTRRNFYHHHACCRVAVGCSTAIAECAYQVLTRTSTPQRLSSFAASFRMLRALFRAIVALFPVLENRLGLLVAAAADTRRESIFIFSAAQLESPKEFKILYALLKTGLEIEVAYFRAGREAATSAQRRNSVAHSGPLVPPSRLFRSIPTLYETLVTFSCAFVSAPYDNTIKIITCS